MKSQWRNESSENCVINTAQLLQLDSTSSLKLLQVFLVEFPTLQSWIPPAVSCLKISSKEESGEKKTQLVKTQADIQQMIQGRLKKIEEIRHSVELSKESSEKEKADSVEVFRALLRCIERIQAELLEVMEEKQKAAERQAEEFIKELEQEITELKRRDTELEQLSHTEDHLHLLQVYPSLCSPPHTKNWTDVRINTHLRAETLRRALTQLQEELSKEMEKVVEIEMKRIQQYAVDVTLDPDTANPLLILSDEGKQVTCGDTEQNLPDTPERFDDFICVLGKEGFSSGRFYYEVQVSGKIEWDLGVTTESSNRKGEITLSPEDGYWTVFLRNETKYVALDSPPVPLSLKQAPQKVGVFVDYEEGLVSFYDVESRSHIYSFTGQSFTEKLYPYFCPCDTDGEFIKELEQEITELKRRDTELEQLSHTEDHLHLLQVYPSLCSPPPTKNWTDVRINAQLRVETLRRALAQLQEELTLHLVKVFHLVDKACKCNRLSSGNGGRGLMKSLQGNESSENCVINTAQLLQLDSTSSLKLLQVFLVELPPLQSWLPPAVSCLKISSKEASGEKKTQLVKTQADVQQMIQDRLKKIEEIRHSVELSKESSEEEKADSVEVFRALLHSIERSQAELLEVMEEKQKAAERQAEEFIKELEQEITELKRRDTELEQLSHTEDHLHLLQVYPSLCSPPPTKNWTDVRINSHLRGETLRRALAQLQEELSKEMEKVEMKRIQQYAVDVTLDPDTANPLLILSDEGKQVTCGDTKQNLPHKPERFDDCVCVLGKEGFSSGRFYYEVQVSGKTEWELGVSTESSNRKGYITLSPEDGYWTVSLSNETEYVALESPPVTLSLKQAPQKVGVFVDYEEGLVSFYDVESRSHIYSFTGQSFTEKLYPYFSPYDTDGGRNSALLIITPVDHDK
ncbi:hypothetical protein SRHO_G00031720 [Serrasalmus rhombeus]